MSDNEKTRRDELLAGLLAIAATNNGGDLELNHINADNLLLKYIDDVEVSNAFDEIEKWYS